MKRVISLICVVMLAVVLLTACDSAPKISGTYSNETIIMETRYQFDEEYRVTVKFLVAGYVTWEDTGTYSIDKETSQITLEFGEDTEDLPSGIDILSGTFDFEQTDSYIMIGKVEYKKVS